MQLLIEKIAEVTAEGSGQGETKTEIRVYSPSTPVRFGGFTHRSHFSD